MPLKGTVLQKSLENIKIAPELRAAFRKRLETLKILGPGLSGEQSLVCCLERLVSGDLILSPRVSENEEGVSDKG